MLVGKINYHLTMSRANNNQDGNLIYTQKNGPKMVKRKRNQKRRLKNETKKGATRRRKKRGKLMYKRLAAINHDERHTHTARKMDAMGCCWGQV